MRDKALKAMRDALNAQFSDTISPLGIRAIASHALTAYESHLQAEGRAVVPGWQPIESAPKDGTRILVCGPAENGATYMDACAWPKGWSGQWPTAYMAYAAGDATHWMPLPAPPNHTQEKDA